MQTQHLNIVCPYLPMYVQTYIHIYSVQMLCLCGFKSLMINLHNRMM